MLEKIPNYGMCKIKVSPNFVKFYEKIKFWFCDSTEIWNDSENCSIEILI